MVGAITFFDRRFVLLNVVQKMCRPDMQISPYRGDTFANPFAKHVRSFGKCDSPYNKLTSISLIDRLRGVETK